MLPNLIVKLILTRNGELYGGRYESKGERACSTYKTAPVDITDYPNQALKAFRMLTSSKGMRDLQLWGPAIASYGFRWLLVEALLWLLALAEALLLPPRPPT